MNTIWDTIFRLYDTDKGFLSSHALRLTECENRSMFLTKRQKGFDMRRRAVKRGVLRSPRTADRRVPLAEASPEEIPKETGKPIFD